jgi:hypothetical protein
MSSYLGGGRDRSNYNSKRNNFASRSSNVQTVAESGEVTNNIDIPSTEFISRCNAARESFLKGKNGLDNIYPDGGLYENHDFIQGDMVLGWKNKGRKMTALPGKLGQQGFSTLNGITLSDYESAKQLMKDLYFIGFSKSTVKPFDTTETGGASGLAVRCRGSTSIRLRGIHQFYANDKIVAYLPPFKDSYTYSSSKLGFLDQSPTRLTPLIKPLDISDIQYEYTNAISVALDEASETEIFQTPVWRLAVEEDQRRLNNEDGSVRDHSEELASFIKRSTMNHVMAAIRVLLYLGILKIGNGKRNNGIPDDGDEEDQLLNQLYTQAMTEYDGFNEEKKKTYNTLDYCVKLRLKQLNPKFENVGRKEQTIAIVKAVKKIGAPEGGLVRAIPEGANFVMKELKNPVNLTLNQWNSLFRNYIVPKLSKKADQLVEAEDEDTQKYRDAMDFLTEEEDNEVITGTIIKIKKGEYEYTETAVIIRDHFEEILAAANAKHTAQKTAAEQTLTQFSLELETLEQELEDKTAALEQARTDLQQAEDELATANLEKNKVASPGDAPAEGTDESVKVQYRTKSDAYEKYIEKTTALGKKKADLQLAITNLETRVNDVLPGLITTAGENKEAANLRKNEVDALYDEDYFSGRIGTYIGAGVNGQSDDSDNDTDNEDGKNNNNNNNSGPYVAGSIPSAMNQEKNLVREELIVGRILGLACPVSSSNNRDEFSHVQNDILKTAFYGELPCASVSTNSRIEQKTGWVDDGLAYLPLDVGLRGKVRPSENDRTAAYLETCSDAPHALRGAFSLLCHSLTENVVGVALNSGKPGTSQILDVMIGGQLYTY